VQGIDLVAENNRFSMSAIAVPGDALIHIRLTSMDPEPHNLSVYETEAAEEDIFVGELVTGPDQTVVYELTSPATAGTYFFRCDVHPAEMRGDFIVG
ncbi:MAG: cupredoxin domain-containing protein, partial [Actinomycetota bacterium]|nr:cupredoxin domain-containing protein [Actinomycetota bacterium]